MRVETTCLTGSTMAYDLATRAQVVTLKAYGLSSRGVESFTGVSIRTVDRIYARALDREFDPDAEPCKVLNFHVHTRRRGMRPRASLMLSPPSSPGVQLTQNACSDTEEDPFERESSEDDRISAHPDLEHSEGNGNNSLQSSSASDTAAERAPPTAAAPVQHHATRYLQVEAAMSPLFASLSESNKLATVVWTGDMLVREDAVRFLRDDLPSWHGTWERTHMPKPTSGESSLVQVAKMSKCVSLMETRSKTDFVRLRFHRILQYQAFTRCLTETQMTPRISRKTATTHTTNRILQRIYTDWMTATATEKQRRREVFRAQRRAGKRLQICCNHMGYGFLLLSSQSAIGKMCVV